MTRSLVRLVAKNPSSVAIELLTLPVLQPCVGNTSIHPVENAMCRKLCQYRHGFSYARSATMMDDTLTIVFLEPMKMVTILNDLFACA